MDIDFSYYSELLKILPEIIDNYSIYNLYKSVSFLLSYEHLDEELGIPLIILDIEKEENSYDSRSTLLTFKIIVQSLLDNYLSGKEYINIDLSKIKNLKVFVSKEDTEKYYVKEVYKNSYEI